MDVKFWFDTTAFMHHVHYHLKANVDGMFFEVQRPELVAYLVNKHAKKVVIDEYGFGYNVELPENAALALIYMLYRRMPPSKEELDEIAAREQRTCTFSGHISARMRKTCQYVTSSRRTLLGRV